MYGGRIETKSRQSMGTTSSAANDSFLLMKFFVDSAKHSAKRLCADKKRKATEEVRKKTTNEQVQ